MTISIIRTDAGDVFYLRSKQLHRSDGPAIEWAAGGKEWYLDGKRHRLDGPAIEWKIGDYNWYIAGQLHRDNGPAIERSSGHREWYRNGLLDRLDGPARELEDGTKEWFREGLRHRLDGPAVTKPVTREIGSGMFDPLCSPVQAPAWEEWWCCGEKISNEYLNLFSERISEMRLNDRPFKECQASFEKFKKSLELPIVRHTQLMSESLGTSETR